MKASFLLPFVLAAAAIASPAIADEPVAATFERSPAPGPTVEAAETPPPEEIRTRTEWYGWQTLATDGIAAGMLAGAALVPGAAPDQLLAGAGLGTLALGAPIVHATHGRWLLAAADLGLRLGVVSSATVTGALLGAAIGGPPCHAYSASVGGDANGCTFGGYGPMGEGAAVGFTLGAAGAAVVDAAVFARRKVRVSDDPAASAMTWSPTVTPRRDGATAGVVGRF